jgi:uncharacterized protein YjhX (UPF0386 family)
MAVALTREALRQRIDLLEALESVMAAIDDTSGVEFEDGEERVLDLQIGDRSQQKQVVASAHAIPHDVLLAGLQAMRAKLEQRLGSAS